jgi:uncharacterized protein (TIGR03118 family)
MTRHRIGARRGAIVLLAVCLGVGLAPTGPARAGDIVQVIPLISDTQTFQTPPDPDLKNPWGLSFSPSAPGAPGSPFWISDNHTGLTTLYRVNPATDATSKLGFVTIPSFPPGGTGNPTGQVFNSTTGFSSDRFLFVSEDGTISGWRGSIGLGNTAEVIQTGDPANIYKGVALETIGDHTYLLAANFGKGTIDVLKGDPSAPDLIGKFTDPNLPANFAPFNIEKIGDKIYVAYAVTNGTGDDQKGPGNGIVDVFDANGNFLGRIASNRGSLNSPWGMAIAPASFGSIAGDLLVGNFGDGRINIFGLNANDTGTFLGQLMGTAGAPLFIDGLWTLTAGNDGSAGSSQKLYFTAGPNDEANGLFGVIQSVPEPSSIVLGLIAVVVLAGGWQWPKKWRRPAPAQS